MTTLDPLHQFMVTPVIPLHIAGINLSITNSVLYMMFAVVGIVLFFWLTLRKVALVPQSTQSLAEMPIGFVQNIVQEINGSEGQSLMPLVSAVFLFVFMGNILGLIPFAFTFTSQIIINLALAGIVVGSITLYGIYKQGTSFFRVFFAQGIPWWIAPIMVPIELISYLSRPLSLAVRLFANMVAGHSMLKIFAYFSVSTGILGVCPLAVNVLLLGFEFLVAFLQAYVFAMLTCIYLNDALHHH